MYSLAMFIVTFCINTSANYKAQVACQKELTGCYNQTLFTHQGYTAEATITYCLLNRR